MGGRRAWRGRCACARDDMPDAAAAPPDSAEPLPGPDTGERLPQFVEAEERAVLSRRDRDPARRRQARVRSCDRLDPPARRAAAGCRAVAARARLRGRGLRQRAELDPAVRRVAVRQHRSDRPPAPRAGGGVDRPRRAHDVGCLGGRAGERGPARRARPVRDLRAGAVRAARGRERRAGRGSRRAMAELDDRRARRSRSSRGRISSASSSACSASSSCCRSTSRPRA